MKAVPNSGSVLLPNGHTTRERGAGSLLSKKAFTTGLVARHLKMARATSRAGLMSLLALNAMVFAIIFPIYNIMGTNDTEAVAGTPIDSMITFNATRSTASVDLMVTDTNGTFASSTAASQAAFSLSTNNYTGYTLMIAANSDTSSLSNAGGGTLASITTSVSEATFNTADYNNKWGYKPNYLNSVANSNYLPSPTTTATTLDKTAGANSTAKSYTIAIGARADYASVAGTYTSTRQSSGANYKLMYIANPVAYSVTYSDNSGDSTVASLPAAQFSDSVTTDAVLLSSSKPTRTGYTFKSWCLGTVTDSGTRCSGTEYAAGASFGIDRTESKVNNTSTLYAVWTLNTFTCYKQYRLENADGSWGSYIADGSEKISYGGSCSYTKSVNDYRGGATANNGTTGSTNISNMTSDQTLSISMYRNTYSLTVGRNTTYISSASATTAAVRGTNEYRWGQVVSISATAATNSEFTAWTQSGTTGVFGDASLASTTFTMGKGAATVTAGGKASCITSISGYMQDAPAVATLCEGASGTMTDRRDEKTYTVKRINGALWMTQNLRITGYVYATDSNFSGGGINVSYGDISSTESCRSGDTRYTQACSKDSGSTDTGVWYNYYAASAGTVGEGGPTIAPGDICPASWHLPSYNESGAAGSINSLINYQSDFNPVTGGVYYTGSVTGLVNPGIGVWWSNSTRADSNSWVKYTLNYGWGTTGLDTDAHGSGIFGSYGAFIRCVKVQ